MARQERALRRQIRQLDETYVVHPHTTPPPVPAAEASAASRDLPPADYYWDHTAEGGRFHEDLAQQVERQLHLGEDRQDDGTERKEEEERGEKEKGTRR